MIKIKKGDSALTVTPGAYKNYFKPLGYKPAGVPENGETSGEGITLPPYGSQLLDDSIQLRIEEEVPPENGEEPAEAPAEEEAINLSEIPLSEMSFGQLCEYADELGLGYEGIRSKKELRKLIREHLS